MKNKDGIKGLAKELGLTTRNNGDFIELVMDDIVLMSLVADAPIADWMDVGIDLSNRLNYIMDRCQALLNELNA